MGSSVEPLVLGAYSRYGSHKYLLERKWEAWFNEYTSINTAEMADWKQKSIFREWFDQLQALLDGNTAASLAKKLQLQEQVDILNQFSSNLENEYTVYQKLYDNGYRTYGDDARFFRRTHY